MIEDMISVIRSLTMIMREETEVLGTPFRMADLGELAAAKTRLVASLEADSTRLAREQPDWIERLEPEVRDQLVEAVREMRDISEANGAVLRRQIALSVEMMECVTAEARRLSGTRSSTYSATGNVRAKQLATPLSINSHY